tara:strand:- start:386 stop:685 length:300 start_codon:yes stop_codon:yes gene_type:complete
MTILIITYFLSNILLIISDFVVGSKDPMYYKGYLDSKTGIFKMVVFKSIIDLIRGIDVLKKGIPSLRGKGLGILFGVFFSFGFSYLLIRFVYFIIKLFI